MLIVEREPSHGKQINRRRVLAEARREPPPDREERRTADSKDDPIRQARIRLSNVELALSPGNEESMTPLNRASLELEQTWLEFRVGKISENEKTARLQGTLNRWQTTNSEVFNLLNRENGNGVTPLVEIRDRVIPRVRIGGFHTKRR